MNPNRFFVHFAFCIFLITSSNASAQKNYSVDFKNGSIVPEPNLRKAYLDSFSTTLKRHNNKALVLLQFENIPDAAALQLLSANGVQLLEYISGNAYTATIGATPNAGVLANAKARSVVALQPRQKMDPFLAKGMVPSWAVKAPGTIDVLISFPKTFSVTEVLAALKNLNVEVIDLAYQQYRILSLRIAVSRFEEIAAQPFVEYLQAAPPESQPLNYNSRYGVRANLLNASVASGGRGLNGEGVVVGIGDNADIQTHVDFKGRTINRAAAPSSAHGTHVSGIVGGAGNINEQYRGFAPKATLLTQVFSRVLTNAATYVQDYGMVVTNNSYADIIECDYFGTYDLMSRAMDQMAFDLPQLSNVFAAGNSGLLVCPPFAQSFRTVIGGYQTAKNVLTVGATNDSGLIANFSSRGPVRDGRLKPEIVTMGQFVASTWPTNIYSYNNGTSMAAPAASGGLALLYQRYRQLNAGANPKNGLMKALLCNGAADRGNAGPDYKYGYGWMNLLRSVEMMEGTRYFNTTVAQAATNTHIVTVPSNTAQLKVLLYWNDPAASPLSNKMLVNDLDLQVVDASSATNLPRILDTAVGNVNNVATMGVDRLNNIEQVVINNPAAGNYSIKIIGSALAQNPTQEYFVVYDVVPVQLKITAPAGGEGLAPSNNAFDMMKINWEAYGFSSGTATLEFSGDGGATWSVIDASVDINRSIFTWWVPNVATDKALVRITKHGTGETSTSGMFTIVAQPVVTLDALQCEGYIKMNWTTIAGVTDYEVMMLLGDEMKTVTTTTGNTYTFSGLSKDSVYWVTVRPRVNGKSGKRALAIQRQPASGTCAGNISDGDLKIDAILSPVSGRRFTSTQLTSTSAVSVRIKNIDDAPAANFEVKYSINGGAFISETVTAAISAAGTYVHTFSTPANLLATGNYLFTFMVKNTGDAVAVNDTMYSVVKHIDNQPLNLSTYFIDDIETAIAAAYPKDTVGLAGVERYDYTRSTIYGRARTFVNTGIAFSGSKAITLDADRFYPPGNSNFLYGTFNLSNYNAVVNDLRFDFRFLNHGQPQNAVNKVWVRGADTQPWVEAYDLDDNQEDAGIYKKTGSIELSDLVANAGQLLTASLQVRWGQWGQLPATEKDAGAGYTFDDIRFYEVANDVQMKSIDAPLTIGCGLTNATPITVSVRNSANITLTNIPVQYRVNNGPWVAGTITSIAGNTTVQYTFTATANLTALGTHTIEAVVNFATDNFKENDTISVIIRNQPVVATFPYLQNFESSDGYWYAVGKRNTWEYGTPASARIKSAASGSKAWKTRLRGHYSDMETSYLYSPCFDITSMAKPTLSFSVALDIEDCGTTLCDAAWVEYSTDGVSWSKFGAAGSGTNWYNKTASQVWSTQTYHYWHVASTALPTGMNSLRLRFAFASDEGVTREGIAIDDIHIYDNTKGIYDGLTMTAPVTQSVSGNTWVDVTIGGKLVASLQPMNQNLGSTAVQAFILDSAVRYNNSQYYHHRNSTIKPTNVITDSVGVRFYFLDKETDTLLRATGCSTCGKPASAYELGVSKYSDPDKSFENGTVLDNQQGFWQFIPKGNVAIVPFDAGYYAEFKVKDFSEFWLNNGGFAGSTPLPVKMMDFAAQKTGATDVLLTWKVGSETDVLRYEIEVAKGNDALQAGQFIKVGEVLSAGNSTTVRNYSFTDTEANKSGARFYRLKIINASGAPVYSPIRSVVFDDVVLWQVYPNPSRGQFFLQYQVNNNQQMEAKVYDSKGSLVKMEKAMGTGLQQKLVVDLSKGVYATGVYLLKIQAGDVQRSFKLFKQ